MKSFYSPLGLLRRTHKTSHGLTHGLIRDLEGVVSHVIVPTASLENAMPPCPSKRPFYDPMELFKLQAQQ